MEPGTPNPSPSEPSPKSSDNDHGDDVHPAGPSSLVVREADAWDAEPIASILEEVGVTKLLAEPDPLTRTRLRTAIAASDDTDHSVLVAVSEDTVVGFIAVHWTHNFRQGIDGYVSDLFVRSDRRGLGAGTALIEAMKRRAVRRGCQRLVLFNGKRSEAYERDFYPKLGFSEHDELACFILELPPEGFPD